MLQYGLIINPEKKEIHSGNTRHGKDDRDIVRTKCNAVKYRRSKRNLCFNVNQ